MPRAIGKTWESTKIEEKSHVWQCQREVELYGGKKKICGGALGVRTVMLEMPDRKLIDVCHALICINCLGAIVNTHGEPILLGLWVKKTDDKLFNLPRDIWQGDWSWRQKFLWELKKEFKANPRNCYIDYKILADRVGCAPVLNEAFVVPGQFESLVEK